MNHKTNYPPGSSRDILIRLCRTERDIVQLLNDVRSANEFNPNLKDEPIDTGRYVVRLKQTRDVIARVREVIARGEDKVPDGIMQSLCEPW